MMQAGGSLLHARALRTPDDTPHRSPGSPASGLPAPAGSIGAPNLALPALARLRAEAADRIQALISFLDATEPDPDLEDGQDAEDDKADAEPSMGATEAVSHLSAWRGPAPADGEAEEDDHGEDDGTAEEADPTEDDGSAEPWLAAPENAHRSQIGWAAGSGDDLEIEARRAPDMRPRDRNADPVGAATRAIRRLTRGQPLNAPEPPRAFPYYDWKAGMWVVGEAH